MAETFTWGNMVPNYLLEFFDIRKPTCFLSAKNKNIIDMDIKNAPLSRSHTNFLDLFIECHKEFLHHPCSSEHPPALSAIRYGDDVIHNGNSF